MSNRKPHDHSHLHTTGKAVFIDDISEPKGLLSGKVYYSKDSNLSYIPQWVDLDKSLSIEVKDVVLMGLGNKFWFMPSKSDKLKVAEALESLGFDKNFSKGKNSPKGTSLILLYTDKISSL